jgi:tetratricopeptide (TPR) repeat protein
MSELARLNRGQKLALGAIVLGAFALRLVYVLEARANPYFDAPVMDPLYHLEWARALAAGEVFQAGPFFRAPLYPWFLGGVLHLFGPDLLLPRILQAALGALTTYLTFAIGRRAFDARVGFLAAGLVAVNWVLIYFDGELLIPTLAIPLNLAAVLASLRLGPEARPRSTALAGLLWGLAALARPNVLLFLPFLFLWLVLRSRPSVRNGFLQGLTLTLGVLLPILPVTAYNAVAGEDAVLISSQAGVNLWIGNNPTSDGSTAIVPDTRPGWWDGFNDSIALAEQSEGRALLPSEVSRHYSRRARNWALEHPADALAHLAWKLRLFWMDWELGNNADVNFFATRFSVLMRWLPPGFGLLAPLALLGLWACRRSPGPLFPLWGFTLTYMASVVLFFVCARFRAPILPLFAVLAGATLVSAFELLRARRLESLALGLALFILAAVGVQQLPPRLDTTDAKGLWALGIHELGQDRPREAQALLRESLAQNPRYWIAHKDLGLAQMAAGELLEATASFEAALALVPNDAQARASLVDVLIARADIDRAQATARAGLQLNPGLAQAHDSMATVHVARADWSAARAALHAGLRAAPEDFNCNFRLGALELEHGDPCLAVEPLERASAGRTTDRALHAAVIQALDRARRACEQ